jgi:hypothetical protein
MENSNSPKLVEIISNNLLFYDIYAFYKEGWRFMILVNYRQQTPPHLGFYSSSRKGWIIKID